MKENHPTKSNNNLLIIIIAAVIAVAAIIVVIILAVSGVFGAKEYYLYNGLNELKPGTYLCTNNNSNYVDSYISTDGRYDAEDYTEIIFRANSTTSVIFENGKKLNIDDSGKIDIVCTRQ